jgi:hypothetical protein
MSVALGFIDRRMVGVLECRLAFPLPNWLCLGEKLLVWLSFSRMHRSICPSTRTWPARLSNG